MRPRQAARSLLAATWATALAGCGIQDPASPAVDLYHNLQGGAIAQQRPPPPGANDPYPNLGTIPPRPTAPDIAAQQTVADRLASQRDSAQRAAAASPLVAAQASPRPAPAKAAAPDPNGNRVMVDAAPAPPPTPPASAPAGIADVPALPEAITSGPLPSFALAPPPLPIGVALTIPLPSSAPPPEAAAPQSPPAANTVVVAFTPGSATLPPSANLNLRRFALAHKGVALTAIGHGDAVLAPPDTQAMALELALHRAQAIAAALGDAGVPAGNLRLRAEAAGQGGAATL